MQENDQPSTQVPSDQDPSHQPAEAPAGQEPAADPNTPELPGIGEESVFAADGTSFFSREFIEGKALEIFDWIKIHVLSVDTIVQFSILLGALIPAALFGPSLKKLILERLVPLLPLSILKRAARALAELATPIALFVTLNVARTCLSVGALETYFVDAGIALLSAWIVIRLVTLVIRSPFWSRVAFYVAWPVAALDAFNVLDNVLGELDKIAFPLGENELGETVRFSALDSIRVLVIFAALLGISNLAKRFLSDRIHAVDELTPSIKALLVKIIGILMPIIALLIALQVVGFNLATLTIFGGAIGLGVGLGLQKTISNFIAGFTLIADKSIKPGDIIEVGETFGWVTAMGTRYVTVRTRDGTEHLVPNDRFIEDGVINWSHADRVVRLHASISVAYGTKDVRMVAALCEEQAKKIERVLATPAPRCNLVEFADSSIDFDLRFWISDPANGITNVRSDVMMAVWDALHEHNIEIPYPQRDLHIKTMPAGLMDARAETRVPQAGTDKKQDIS